MSVPKYPQSQSDRVHAYLLVMEEVRARIGVVNSVLATATIDPGLIAEICYLQLRHISELVAIGCLLAYGDFSAYRSFEKEYSPVEVFKHLEKMWPHFFPQCVTMTSENGVHRVDANSKPNAMTRKEMEALWSKSGDKLHRLSISKFFKARPKIAQSALDEVRSTTSKIVDLLDKHLITIPSPDRVLLVHLSQPDCRVRAQFMTRTCDSGMSVEEFNLQ